MWRGLLIFIVGILVGANATYFLMTRDSAQSAVVAVPSPSAPATPADSAPVPVATPTPPEPATAASPRLMPPPLRPGELIVPVQGITADQLQNTFDQARSEGRVHEAIDIMAPRGTPVFAVADGFVVKLFNSRQGGITLYQFDPTRTYSYYYAHLDRYADGVTEGRVLKQGELIGYVGSTGNANPDGPHLHFAVNILGPEKQWSKGTPINPYPLLGGA